MLAGLKAKTHGSGMVHITRKPFDEHPVWLPPQREQELIADAIEEEFSQLDAGSVELHRVRRNLKRMRETVLQAAVTGRLVHHAISEDVDGLLERIASDRCEGWRGKTAKAYPEPAAPAPFPLAIPNHWRITSLEALTDATRVICYGILMPKEHISTGVPYVRVKDMQGWTINVSGLRRTAPEIAKRYARSSLMCGDLLLAIRGSFGRVAIIPAELEGANITQDSARIAPHPELDRRYLLYYLGGSVANRYYRQVARGVAVKGVNIGDLRTMPVPVPPVSEQVAIADEIERKFDAIDRMEATVAAQLRRGTSLRSSILAAAFSGALIRQDPSHEPAAVLLQRLGAARNTSKDHQQRRDRGARSTVTV